MAVILVIEDKTAILDNICDCLIKEDYEVLMAENGSIGLQKAKEHQPDLILCDINMPGINGFEVLEEIRNAPDTLDIPFIFLTVRKQTVDIVKGFDLGAQDYIKKPYDNKELLARVRAHLELKKYRETLKRIWNESSEELYKAEKEIAVLKLYIEELKSDEEELHRKELFIEKLENHLKLINGMMKTFKSLKEQSDQNRSL